MAEPTKLADYAANTKSSDENSAELKHFLDVLAREGTKHWNLLHGSLRNMPEGMEPKKAMVAVQVTWKNVKKEAEDSMSVHAEGKHDLQTKAVTAKGGFKQGKMFFGHGDSIDYTEEEPDEE